MTGVLAEWSATISVRPGDPALVSHLERALGPEAAREVPRSTARVRRAPGDRLEIEISAQDSGAMRAALNTYLGWIHLAIQASHVAGAEPAGSASRGPRSRSA